MGKRVYLKWNPVVISTAWGEFAAAVSSIEDAFVWTVLRKGTVIGTGKESTETKARNSARNKINMARGKR